LSKIIKSEHFVEAHPCRLDPVDVDAFFVNSQEEDETPNTSSEADSETAATLEEILETIFPPGENMVDDPKESDPNDFEDLQEIESEIKAAAEPTEDEPEETAAQAQEIDLFKINLEAEKLIDESKQKADVLTQLAREKADNITGVASEKAAGIIEEAKAVAAEIETKAQAKAGEIIEQAKTQANEALEQAKQEATKIIGDAKLQAEELKTQAEKQGFAAGHKEGLAKAKQEIEANLENSISILAQAEEERVRRIISSEAELLRLVTGIVEKVIGSELKSHPEQILSVVKGALSRVATANTITIKINPDDGRLIEENLPSLQEVFTEPKSIAIRPDQTIAPGDCFVETEHGKVDARIKSQLERIMNEILKAGQINESE
jgi:flagellar assembly protein FliH